MVAHIWLPRASAAIVLLVHICLSLCACAAVIGDKHASELDLGCDSYSDGVDWVIIREQVKAFLREPMREHHFLKDLLVLAKRRPKTDCYIGLCSLGYLSLAFMTPDRRRAALEHTLFGSVPLHEQIPLSFWDTIASRWPIFGLLEMVGAEVRGDGLPGPAVEESCCDRLGTDAQDASFLELLWSHLAVGTLVPASASLRYLAQAPTRCSWGKAAAYFALAEFLLQVRTPRMEQAGKDALVLGEFQVEHCAPGRNVTVSELLFSEWPWLGFLRRIEAEALIVKPSQELRVPPGYEAPPPGRLQRGYRVPASSYLRAGANVIGPPVTPGVNVRSGGSDGCGSDGATATAGRSPLPPSPPATEDGLAADAHPSACGVRDVHIALAGDYRHLEGVLATVNSVIAGTSSPTRICIHIFCLAGEVALYRSVFHCSFGTSLVDMDGSTGHGFQLSGAVVQFHVFHTDDVLTEGLAVDAGVLTEAGDLNTPHNFVRFRLAQWIPPEVTPRLVYLDTDVVVRGDVCELYDAAFRGRGAGEQAILAAVPRRQLPLSVYLKALSPRMPIWLPSASPSFNAGVMVIDMLEWQRADVTGRVDRLARLNVGRDLWRHGSQPPLLLLLHDRIQWLDGSWNVDGLGHRRERPPDAALAGARILHWTGPLKPWLRGGLHRDLWEPFSVHCWRGGDLAPGSSGERGGEEDA